jgi:hypothetical protein
MLSAGFGLGWEPAYEVFVGDTEQCVLHENLRNPCEPGASGTSL